MAKKKAKHRSKAKVSDTHDIPGADDYKPVRATMADFMDLGINALIDRARPTLSQIITRVLSQVARGKKEPALLNVIRKQIKKAEAGDVKAAEFLFNRAFGMPKQSIETNGEVINKLQIEIVHAHKHNGKAS